MPWYRIPGNLRRRAELAAACGDISKAGKAMLDLLQFGSQAMNDDTAGGMVHINFGRAGNRAAPRPCAGCGWISERLCDFKLPNGRTCDRALCLTCTSSPAPGKDLCPEHELVVRAWLAGRTNTTDGDG